MRDLEANPTLERMKKFLKWYREEERLIKAKKIVSTLAELKEKRNKVHEKMKYARAQGLVEGYISPEEMKQARKDAKKAKAQNRRQNMPKKMGKRVAHIYTQVDKIQSATQSMQIAMHKIEMQMKHMQPSGPAIAEVSVEAESPADQASFRPYLQPVY